jgi:hypothetical protein
MNIIKTAAAALPLFVAACATPPNDIKATNVSASKYAGWSCAKLDAELARINSDISPLLLAQDRTSRNDFDGVFWLGVPVGSMTDKTDIKAREARIAEMKGLMAGINVARKNGRCINGTL